MRRVMLPILCSCLALLGGCVVPPTPAMHTTSTRPLERQVYAQNKQLEQLTSSLQQLSTTVSANNKELLSLRHEIQQLKSHQGEKQQIGNNNQQTVTSTIADAPQATTQPDKPTATKLYLQGFSAYTNGNYPTAISNFTSFINNYPRNPYIPNAYYWLGTSFMAQGNRIQATAVFTSLVNDYPQAHKAADAQLKLVKLYAQSNQKQQALAALTRLQQQYHDSSANKNIAPDLLESLSH
ncbi:MAG: tol-pal system protein YbgF [Desulfobacteraceae bacterium 4572_35.1]|nr:MAG: tol-pal system protein YbgF [Desulfobacteraceae bacterium 4572_35.1]